MRFAVLVSCFFGLCVARGAERPFELRFVDAVTGRGIPLVEARTVNGIRYVSDSAGRIAFDEPGLLGGTVFFHLRCHGYDVPKDGLGSVGVRRETRPGGRAVVRLKRRNIAERLYRITGQGIYADSVRLGHRPPIQAPALNGRVMGQDSAQAVIYREKIHWFWGDTERPSYPLGHFQAAGATALLPAAGGLDPAIGVNLDYFVGDDGFSRPLAPMSAGGLVWIDGLLVAADASGREVMLAHFSRRKDLGTQLEHGLLRYDDEKDVFTRIATWDAANTWRHPRGQATRHEGWFYFAHPFATTRVPANLEAILNPDAYEALALVSDAGGKESYRWQKQVAPIEQAAEAKRLRERLGDQTKPVLQLWDAATGKPVKAHAGSIRWNAHRQRWLLICAEIGGTSFLGETWYAEATAITGPWGPAVKIVTHEKYSFYNPVQHDFFDQEGGRQIHFEGTYTKMFSGNEVATPRYDYNQIMYRLDLDDPRLKAAWR